MQFDLFSLIGPEGLVVFSAIAMVSFVLLRIFAPYSVLSQGALDCEMRSSEALASTPKAMSTKLTRRTGFRIPRADRVAIRALRAAEAAKCGKAAMGIVEKGADYAGKAGKSVRVLVGSALEIGKNAASRSVALRPAQIGRAGSQSEFVDATSEFAAPGEELRLDFETQWQRVTGVVTDGIERAERIEGLHEAAASQLDAVDYAYERMLEELQTVLPGVSQAQVVCRSNREEAYAEASQEQGHDLSGSASEAPQQPRPYLPNRSSRTFYGPLPSVRVAADAVAA